MHRLELKIPPVALVLIVAAAMWGVSCAIQGVALPSGIRIVMSVMFAMSGVAISIAGVISFRRAKTTVNPTKPDSTSSLVNTGVYSITRNPMYLGFLLALIGWAVFLSNAWALIGAAVFVLYMNRFQIAPEERALAALFGAEFADYKTRVRRWL